MKKLITRFHIFLSHHSWLYALIAGVGIVLFWRGVWHTVDFIHIAINHVYSTSPIDLSAHLWWDGPLSFLVGCLLLYLCKAFVSSFIGNELILSGLRTEKKLTKKTENEIETEVTAISAIKEELDSVTQTLEELEEQIKDRQEVK